MPKHANIDQYIGDCAEPVVPLLKELRAFIHTTLPNATEAMQYGAPVFINANNAPVIYLFGSRDHVNFGFLRSAELSDPQGILQGSGKPSKHVKIFPGQPVDKPTLRAFIKQCEIMMP